ncbi:hypothetical protein AVEN_41820-2-1, partial [Araneus ventricosus]
KVASQQCEPYGWEESFTEVSMGYWNQPGMDPDLGNEIWDLKDAGIF